MASNMYSNTVATLGLAGFISLFVASGGVPIWKELFQYSAKHQIQIEESARLKSELESKVKRLSGKIVTIDRKFFQYTINIWREDIPVDFHYAILHVDTSEGIKNILSMRSAKLLRECDSLSNREYYEVNREYYEVSQILSNREYYEVSQISSDQLKRLSGKGYPQGVVSPSTYISIDGILK